MSFGVLSQAYLQSGVRKNSDVRKFSSVSPIFFFTFVSTPPLPSASPVPLLYFPGLRMAGAENRLGFFVGSMLFVCLLVGCLTSQQHASVSQRRICTDNFTCCHTEIEAADQTFHLTQSQYTDTGPTSPSADPITPGAWQGSHWSANV